MAHVARCADSGFKGHLLGRACVKINSLNDCQSKNPARISDFAGCAGIVIVLISGAVVVITHPMSSSGGFDSSTRAAAAFWSVPLFP